MYVCMYVCIYLSTDRSVCQSLFLFLFNNNDNNNNNNNNRIRRQNSPGILRYKRITKSRPDDQQKTENVENCGHCSPG